MRLTGCIGLLVWIFVVVVLFISAAGRSSKRDVGPPWRLFPDGSEIAGDFAKILNWVLLVREIGKFTEKLSELESCEVLQLTSVREKITVVGDVVKATETSSDEDRLTTPSCAPSNFLKRALTKFICPTRSVRNAAAVKAPCCVKKSQSYGVEKQLEGKPTIVRIPRNKGAQVKQLTNIIRRLEQDKAHYNITRSLRCKPRIRFYDYFFQPHECTVADWLSNAHRSPHLNNLDPIRLMKDIAKGLQHVHDSGIVHDGITTENIYLSLPYSNTIRAMIGYSINSQIIQEPKAPHSKKLLAEDIHSLAGVFLQMLLKIDHYKEEDLKMWLSTCYTAVDLIWNMLIVPGFSIHNVLEHPLFWSRMKVVNFWQETSDVLEGMRKQKNWEDVSKILESWNEKLFGAKSWQDYFDPLLLTKEGAGRLYERGLQHLLRWFRNTVHHYPERKDWVKKIIGGVPDGIYEFMTKRYPRFLVVMHHLRRQLKTEAITLPA